MTIVKCDICGIEIDSDTPRVINLEHRDLIVHITYDTDAYSDVCDSCVLKAVKQGVRYE